MHAHAHAAECMSHIPGTWQHQLNIACQPSRARWDQGFFLRTQNPHHVTPPPSSSSSHLLVRSRLTGELELVAKGSSSFMESSGVCRSLRTSAQTNVKALCTKKKKKKSTRYLQFVVFQGRLQLTKMCSKNVPIKLFRRYF